MITSALCCYDFVEGFAKTLFGSCDGTLTLHLLPHIKHEPCQQAMFVDFCEYSLLDVSYGNVYMYILPYIYVCVFRQVFLLTTITFVMLSC